MKYTITVKKFAKRGFILLIMNFHKQQILNAASDSSLSY